jgi:AmpD protein
MNAPLIDDAGWYAPAHRMPSPNCDDRPPDARIELVVIHNISPPLRTVAGHSEIASGRKTDPGACFVWERVRMG